MKHIETPVQVCDSEIINLYYVRDADGDLMTTKITLDEAREIVATINEHDDLIDQRDALVEAAESQMRLTRHLGDCWECGEGLSCKTYDLMDKEATELTIAALAAAKGEKCTGS